ncbi:peptidase domain-containing ABC transporter [Halomonas sp. CUBES01]|uniref:Peptidase domain-containing ABC transporter n=1 Tax=Vreelandella gomseomensis TaxID=370766 RepID=A0ABU1GFD8_9GAMM|nr:MULTISPECIES: peptidase domain-containing ABC transporter [Halomonas]MDR5876027.1 peptidase domain-containing ABC transporter [Halomonas gomseomensis]MEC4766477.1 peptidase domain-containing ABC transporter [Halomonas sp. CUBES01]
MMDSAHDKAGEIALSWFGKTLWKFTPLYIELIFLAICLRLIGLVEPFIFQVIIDRILPFQREASLLVVAAIFVAVSLFQLGFEVLSDLLGLLLANRVTRELGARIFDHQFKLPFGHFRKWSVGESMARVGETDTIRAFLVGTTTGVLLDVVFVFIYIGVLFTLSVPLTLIILVALPIQFLIYFGFGPFLRRRLRAEFDAGAQHQNQMVESIAGIDSIKALSAEKKVLERLDKTLHASLNASYRVGLLQIWSSKLLFVIQQAITISIIYFGAQSVFAGEMTLGQLIAFHLLAGKVTEPIERFSGLWEEWQNVRVSRQRLGDIVNSPMEPFSTLPRLPTKIEARLEFRDVEFHYAPASPVLRHFNFCAEPNTLTLVVGPSGIGKSTFGRLASGIDVPDSGEVLLGGENIAQYEPHDVRTRIAYVPQEPYLFAGTVRQNLTLGDDEASDEAIERALRISAADQLVAQLPEGLDTDVGERGSGLSGGQRQRIAIARSLVRGPKVIILDEPTSALDAQAQRQMAAELHKLKHETTLIIITHNPNIFGDSDQTVDFEAPS